MIELIYILKVVFGTFLASLLITLLTMTIYNLVRIFITKDFNREESDVLGGKLSKVGPAIWYFMMIYIFAF